jgi:hypothetical protein
MPGLPFVARASIPNLDTACTFLQLTAHASRMLEIERAWAGQTSSTTSAQAAIEIVRKTAGASTGLSSITPVCLERVGLAPGFTAIAGEATAEGTDGEVVYEEAFNILNGWPNLPVPEERILVPPSGIIALKFTVAGPANATWKFGFNVREIG